MQLVAIRLIWNKRNRTSAPPTKDAIGEWRVILTLIPIRAVYQTSAGMASVGDGLSSLLYMYAYAETDQCLGLIRFVFHYY